MLTNFGDLEEALEDAQALDKINALSKEELHESIALGKLDLTTAYKETDDSKILFSPQIEIFEPFAAHVDASRTNMSAKQLLQTVTNDNNDTPFIINKNYNSMTKIDSPFLEYAKEDGIIIFSDYNYLVVFYLESNSLRSFYCPKTKKLTNNTITLNHKLKMQGDNRFKKGDVLYDYTGQTRKEGVPNIGYRTKVMYGSFYGYTADDAFVMSESYAERTRIDYSKKIFIPITKELKYLKNSNGNYFFKPGEISDEDFVNYFKIDASDSILSEFTNTSSKQSKIFGKKIDSINGGEIMDFKVHFVSGKKFSEAEEEYIYTPGMIEEIMMQSNRQSKIKQHLFEKLNSVFKEDIATKYSNDIINQWERSSDLPNTLIENVVNDYQIEKENIDYILEIEIFKSEPTCVGDKFANLFAGKGVCSLILPDHLMPDGSDIIFNPLGLFGRNNWGTIFEIALAKIIYDVQNNINNAEDTFIRLNFINEHFIKLYDMEYYERVNDLTQEIAENGSVYEKFKESVDENGFYLLVDNFPGIKYKSFIDNFILPYQETFDTNIIEKEEIVYSKELMQYMRDRGFTHSVFNKEVTQSVKQDVFIGYNYWIKLFHTSYSKYNAISFANNYSKSTGEPPRGRIKKGGCHISWQSTAAFIGHQEHNPASIELRTIKSDAIHDKNNFNLKMIQNGEYILKEKYRSQTVNVLNNSLNMLCLKFSSIYDTHDVDITIETDKPEEFDVGELFTDEDFNEEAVKDLIEEAVEEAVEEDLKSAIQHKEQHVELDNMED